jgi:sirohydrochlorin cobaltochelatase
LRIRAGENRSRAIQLKQGIVLVAHGSRDPEWARPFERLAAVLEKKLPAAVIALCYLEHGPSIAEAIAAATAKGAGSIRVVPMFLGAGGHVKEDIPRLVAAANPAVPVSIDAPIGEQGLLLDAIAAGIAGSR